MGIDIDIDIDIGSILLLLDESNRELFGISFSSSLLLFGNNGKSSRIVGS